VRPAVPTAVAAVPAGATKYFTVNLKENASAADAARVVAYFRGFGLSATSTPENDIIFVHGSYAQAAAAAHTSFARVRVRDRVFTHASSPARFPTAIERVVAATTIEDGPAATSAGIGTTAPTGGYAPADIASYYDIAPLYRAGFSGKGQTVAVLACATVVPGDISAFEQKFGLPANAPTIVNVDGGTSETGLEPTGDVERVIGTAPLASVRLYVVPSECLFSQLADGFAKIAADAAKIKFAAVTHSYGATEDDYAYYGGTSDEVAEDADLALLEKRDVPVFAVSGDWGATFGSSDQALYDGELTVWYPASNPTVIAAGGTEAVSQSATAPVRLFETAWGDGGGGVSEVYPISPWQAAVSGVASTMMRNVPDVALASSAGEAYAAVWTPSGGSQGSYWFYGTSFAAPTWAGLIALAEDERAKAGKKPIANLAATLYKLASTPAFTDITQGCNGYYCAQPGYDNVTGLGVFDGYRLSKELLAQP
jgi:kumamolisin